MNNKLKTTLVTMSLGAVGASALIFGNWNTTTQTASATQPAPFNPISIQEKMLNAIDHYQTLSGTYHIMLKPLGVDQTVNFDVQEGSQPGSHIKKVNEHTGETMVEASSDGDTLLHSDPVKKQFEKEKMLKEDKSQIPPTAQRKTYGTNYQPKYVYRPDPAGAFDVADVTNPQAYAFWLDEESQYRVLGTETLLGRDTTVLSGKLDPVMSQKHQATDFKMWVDSKTGVLLKLEETNASTGEVTNLIEVTDIQFDKGVDRSKFSTNAPAGFQEVKPNQQ